MAFSLNYLYYLTIPEVTILFKDVRHENVGINFIHDNVVNYDLSLLAKKIEVLKKKKIKIGISNMNLNVNNIPLLLNIKPDYVSIKGSYIEDFSKAINKQNTLKQFDNILRSYGGVFVLNKPIDVNQLNEIKDLSFSYIESSFKQ
jgi:EAL domain-containing protein (putative c-di-GMP-specific phosphodiesterase class I)